MEFFPEPPLFSPIGQGGNGAKVSLLDRFLATLDPRQEQNFLLDIWGQVQQIHDLRHPRSADVAEAGKLGSTGCCATGAAEPQEAPDHSTH